MQKFYFETPHTNEKDPFSFRLLKESNERLSGGNYSKRLNRSEYGIRSWFRNSYCKCVCCTLSKSYRKYSCTVAYTNSMLSRKVTNFFTNAEQLHRHQRVTKDTPNPIKTCSITNCFFLGGGSF